MINKIVLAMCTVRLISGSIEILAALWMFRLNQVDKALMINTSLAVVGPIVLLSTTTLGLVGMAHKMSFGKWIWIMVGVGCLCVGILKK